MLPNEQENLISRDGKISATKLAAAQYVITAVLVVLVIGLWRLQVLGAANYRLLAEANRVRKVPILAPRGRLFDREGRLLVDNYSSVTCFLLREQLRDADLPLIAEGLHIPMEALEYTIHHYQYAPKYQPIPLKQDITPDEQAFIEAHRNELPELDTLEEQRRLYPRDGFAAHLIGYVGEISENDLKNPKYDFYEPGDVVGKSGVEETYDAVLRGKDGSRDVIVNSHGRELGRLGEELAVPGKDLKLTIDLDIQMAAEKVLGDKNGAIVAMDPHTGEILAMVSRPTFDPNQFAVRLTRSYWNTIVTDPNHPLMNKAIQAQLAPGSTFKVVMTYAGLQENAAQDLRVVCNGGATFYGHFFGCDRHHGLVDIRNALPYSCDTFYYTLANKLGIDAIAKYGHEVGIGQRTGIDLPSEATGIMPSPQWKLKAQRDKWYAGETISVGIGQGAVQASPMQLARALSGIASGGVFVRPHTLIADQIPAEMQQQIEEMYPGSGKKTVNMSPENWQIITDNMANVTQGIGTAAEAHLEGIDFAGKTGTADVVSGRKKGTADKATLPNAWFVGMTPRRNPDIVVAVLWEHGYWGNNSAKLAAQVISAYVDKQRKRAGNLRQEIAETPKPVDTPAASETKPTPSASVPATKSDIAKPAVAAAPKPKQPEGPKPVARLAPAAAQEPIRTP
ncbi:penicillin-binding protein 2 [Terriglobus roseus]|uniref:Peptidoglycan glycosyltransferase n=1 Tax=Terriglobus roseus TaxID=392734 RepID=A0A1H4KCJ7_9BACT|nr:penicillin-binding protein 2 [Terriglobus roseus]SEB56259.1 peptidoglycan glycosyltransferase [Terriglobus roseus]